jgi:outer membrane protein assembly factor BamB
VLRAQSSARPAKRSSAKPSPLSPYPAELRWTLALNNALVAQPAYDGSNGYFPIQGDRVAAYDLHQGTQRWIVSARPLSAPAVGGGLLFLEQSGGLSALHVADGSVAWTVPLTEKLAVPLVWDSGRLVAGTPTAILSFRAEDGMLQWRRDLNAKPQRTPSLGGDGVYVPMADGRVIALAADTGEILWERRLPEAPNDILVSDLQLFVGSNDNYLYCLNTRDGLTRWRSTRTGADVVSRPTVDGDHVYFVSLDNVLRALNRSNGVQQWKKGLTFRPAWSPIIGADAVMVTGIQGPLLAFYRKDGAPGGELVTGVDLIAAPPYAFESPQALGPMIVVVTRNLKAGATVRAVSHSIEPPPVPLGVLPGLVPVPASTLESPGETRPDQGSPDTEKVQGTK